MSRVPQPRAPMLAVLATLLLSSAMVSCAKSGTDDGGSGAGGIVAQVLDSSLSTPATDSGMFANLPAPWQFQTGGNPSYKDPTLYANVRDKFGGPVDTTNKPVILYPLEQSLHPNNLLVITFQWKQGASTNKLFRIEVTIDASRYDLYVPCSPGNGQCIYMMPQSEWLSIAGHEQASFVVTGTDGNGGAVATSDPVTIHFSSEPVLGGLYYWASSRGTIKRATFGALKAVDYVAPGDATLGLGQTPCVACHSVSRDGKTIAFSVTSPGPALPWGVFVLPTDKPAAPLIAPTLQGGVVTSSFGSNVALNPDGTLVAVNGNETGGKLFLDIRKTADSTSPAVSHATSDPVFAPYDMAIMPEWSPDGNTLAAALVNVQWSPGGCYWDHLACNGTIGLMAWDGANLGKAVPLVKTADGNSESHFYPTWSPDGKWIAFVSQVAHYGDADAGTYQSSYSARNGVLRMVPSDLAGAPYACPGPKCVDLINATQYTWDDAIARNGKGTTLPKFSPFSLVGGSIFFLTYTSRRDYGFTSGDIRQLWMSQIDVGTITDTGTTPPDPSHVPFWVPYQDTNDKNVEPYWTELLSCSKDPNGACKGCVGAEQCVMDQRDRCHCEVMIK